MLLTNHINNVACINKKSPNCWYCRAKVQWLHYITMQLTELIIISFDFAAKEIQLINHCFTKKYPGPRGFLSFFIGKFCDANRFLGNEKIEF